MAIERNGSGYVCEVENKAIEELDHPRPKEYRKYTAPMRKTKVQAEHYKTPMESFADYVAKSRKPDILHEQKLAHKKQVARIQKAYEIKCHENKELWKALATLTSEEFATAIQNKAREEFDGK